MITTIVRMCFGLFIEFEVFIYIIYYFLGFFSKTDLN